MTEANGGRLAHVDEGRVDSDFLFALGPSLGGDIGEKLKGVDELRAAVGVAGEVDLAHANEDVVGG